MNPCFFLLFFKKQSTIKLTYASGGLIMKKSHFIPAFLLSAALLSGLAGCKKETEYYNPNAHTSSEIGRASCRERV